MKIKLQSQEWFMIVVHDIQNQVRCLSDSPEPSLLLKLLIKPKAITSNDKA